jgi:hypothetical protein
MVELHHFHRHRHRKNGGKAMMATGFHRAMMALSPEDSGCISP